MTIERETLHRPLFDKMYEVYVPQYAAQQASGRFLPGEHLTTGNRDLDNMAAVQQSLMTIPLISELTYAPSVLKLKEQGTRFRFSTPYALLEATHDLRAYMDAALDYYAEHPEMMLSDTISDLSRLGALTDSFTMTLSEAGFVVEHKNAMSILEQLTIRRNAHMQNISTTRYMSVINNMRRNSGL